MSVVQLEFSKLDPPCPVQGAGLVDIVLVNLNASVWSKNDKDTIHNLCT